MGCGSDETSQKTSQTPQVLKSHHRFKETLYLRMSDSLLESLMGPRETLPCVTSPGHCKLSSVPSSKYHRPIIVTNKTSFMGFQDAHIVKPLIWITPKVLPELAPLKSLVLRLLRLHRWSILLIFFKVREFYDTARHWSHYYELARMC